MLQTNTKFILVLLLLVITWVIFGFVGNLFNAATPNEGYITNCRAVRLGPDAAGIVLTCETEGGFPDWIIHINNTGGREFTHLVENSYPYDHFPDYSVFVPCGNPSEIRVYNNQLRGDRISLVFSEVL